MAKLNRQNCFFLIFIFITLNSITDSHSAGYPFEQYLNIKHATSPSFSPDGQTIAFQTNITGTYQVWTIPVTGGWPQQATFYDDGIDFSDYSPTANRIAFGKDIGGNERGQIFLVSPLGENLVQLTNKPEVIHHWGGFSRDGKLIAYAANERNQAFFDIYVMELTTGKSKLVHQSDYNNYVAAWAPDGKFLVISRANTSFDSDLYLLDIATGALTHLTPHTPPAEYGSVQFIPDGKGFYLTTDQDRDFTNLAFYNLTTKKLQYLEDEKNDVDGIRISDDGKMLAIVRNIDGYGRLFLCQLTSGSKETLVNKTSEVKLPTRGIVSTGIFSRTGKQLTFTVISPTQNSDIWVYEISSGKLWQVTYSTKAGIPAASFITPTLIKYPTFDGLQIPAFFYLPQGAIKNSALPAILMVHGGPESQERPYFATTYQYYLSRGYAILAPNIRGSTGYGKAYTHLDDIAKRGNAIQDVKYAVEYLKNSGFINPQKIAIMGASYGGYMTLAALTFLPELWAAGVDIVGIANFHTFLKNTGPWRRKLRESEYGYLDKDSLTLWNYSPIHFVDKIKAPLFVIQGANDPRVPQSEAEQIVDQVKKQNGVVEYMLFPDEGHGLSKLSNRIKAYPAVAEFLDRYVKNRDVAQTGASGDR